MITTILAPRSFTRGVLDYNEGKVSSFEAKVVHTMNLAESHPIALYETFDRLESNPRIPAQSRRRSFHMAVNPGPEDSIDEQGVIHYINDLMQYLGYGDQPVVVYRHEDIDRVHYHVVSTRFDANGKKIDHYMEGRRIRDFNLAFGEKYGFSVGAAGVKAEVPEEGIPVFDKKKGNWMRLLDRAFTEALRYPVTSRAQFQYLMMTMNVRCTFRQRKDGGFNVILVGLDGKGKTATRLYSMEKTIGRQAYNELVGRIAEVQGQERAAAAERPLPSEALATLKAKVDFCFLHSGSMEEFIGYLKGLGLGASAVRDGDGTIKRVLVSDPENRLLLDSGGQVGRLSIAAFRKAEEGGHWRKPSPGKRNAVIKAITMPAALLEEMMRYIRQQIDRLRSRIRSAASHTKNSVTLRRER